MAESTGKKGKPDIEEPTDNRVGFGDETSLEVPSESSPRDIPGRIGRNRQRMQRKRSISLSPTRSPSYHVKTSQNLNQQSGVTDDEDGDDVNLVPTIPSPSQFFEKHRVQHRMSSLLILGEAFKNVPKLKIGDQKHFVEDDVLVQEGLSSSTLKATVFLHLSITNRF